ncbi:hypothetical protein WUBG_02891 [Wuchereria bancrofti]|uniref:Uncharacterized protein n=2 Tax=Wuchereria bancrofti TaxID=6293 RepID=J9F9G6_WUCBA|nr:hypothetical protein WUBG_02891 [Wuchereria bancrofti]
MPTEKERGKRINKKPLHKGFSTASWEDRLTDNEKEGDGNITDPELVAEKEYAVENGIEFDMNLVGGRGLEMEVGSGAGSKFADNVKKNTMISTKIKQAKADRKARGRGVSGSMCKKEKGISYGGFHTLMDMDVYYGLDNDEYDTYMSDTEEPFNSHEESITRQEKEKANQSEVDLIDEDMNQMSLNDDDEEEDDDRPGPSRLYYGTGDGGKPKRLYRM